MIRDRLSRDQAVRSGHSSRTQLAHLDDLATAEAPGRPRTHSQLQRLSSGATPGDAKQHNRALVMQTLYLAGPLSRAELARSTGLTKVTISSLVAEFIEEHLIHEVGQRESQNPGKPAMLIDLARHAHAVISVDLSDHRQIRGTLMTLDGQVSARAERPFSGVRGEAAAALTSELVTELQHRADMPLLGVGVGTPGVVDDTGRVRTAPNLDWIDVALRERLEQQTGLPTVVANDANLAALAEYAASGTSDDFILITVGQGVGAGVIVDGALTTGSRFASGEIGQVMVGTDLGLEAEYSREHVLEHWLSVPQLLTALRASETEVPHGASPTSGRERVLREAGQRLGVALVPIIGALNLAEVVLSGPRELLDGTLTDAALETIRRRTLPESHHDLVLRMTEQGTDLVLHGALAAVLHRVLGIG